MKRRGKQPAMPAPRNPHVAAAKFRKAGTHLKSGKALRRNEKMADQRERDRLNRDSSDDSRTLGGPWVLQSIDKNDCTFLSVF